MLKHSKTTMERDVANYGLEGWDERALAWDSEFAWQRMVRPCGPIIYWKSWEPVTNDNY
jgi:hypothetical protein